MTQTKNGMFGTYNPEQGKTVHKVLVYGESGSGKTRFCGSWPTPIFLDIEGGMGSLDKPVARYPSDPDRKIEYQAEVEEFIQEVARQIKAGTFPYKTIVVDSLNELQAVLLQSTVTNYSIKRFYDNLPSQSDYGKMLNDFYRLIREFLALPIHVVFTAVQTNREYEGDRVEPQLIGKRSSKEVCRLMDMVGHTEVVSQDGSLKYLVSFMEGASYVAKDRSPKTVKRAIPNDYKYMDKRY